MKKRILALLCSVAMVFSCLMIAPAQTAQAADGTISIAATESRYVKDGGYVNVGSVATPADYEEGNGNFITQEFIDAGWITFEGGLTAEDFLNGHLTSYVAQSDIIQFNWRDRGSAFADGAAFTLKAGAPLTYKKADGADGTAALDANYTFKFEAPDADAHYNIVRISKVVDNGIFSMVATNVGFVIDMSHNYNYMNISITDVPDWGSALEKGYINEEYIDAGHITLDGMSKDVFLENLRIARLETSNIVQFNYAPRESGFPVGASFTWHKGAPIYYKNSAGVKAVVRLDATYQFSAVASDYADDHNRLLVTKVVVPEYKGEIGITAEGAPFVIDLTNNYNYINVGFEAPDDWSDRYDAPGYVNAEYIDAGHITFDGGLTKEIFLQGLRCARLEVPNIFQFNYALRESGFPVGSSFIWHKGAPIYYKNTAGGISYKTLKHSYKFTVTEGNETAHNAMSIQTIIIPVQKGETAITSEGVSFSINTTDNYNYLNIGVGAVSNFASPLEEGFINSGYIADGHLVLADGLTEDIFFAGWRRGRLETSNVIQLCYDMREAGFPEGSSMTFKKGAPIYYNDTEGGVSYVTLDADYKFVFSVSDDAERHNTSTITLLVCSVNGHTAEVVPGREATCMIPGLTDGSKCSVCEETLVEQQETGFAAHDLVHMDAVTPGCHYIGNLEYWFCKVCEGFWTDAACTQLTNSKSVILPATGSENVEHVEAKESTCYELGNVEYWHCSDCEQFWTDAACTALTNSKSVMLPTKEHNIVHQEEVKAGCHSLGHIEHWFCADCGTFWADEALTQLTNSKNIILPATGSDKMVHVAAKAATCKAEGNVEYWHCPDCEGFWLDAACTRLTNAKSVIIGKADHKAVKLPAVAAQVGKTGLTEGSKCSVCGTILKAQAKTPALKLAAPKASKVTKATGGKKQITVKFKKISGVTRYEIQYSLKKNMKGAKTVKVTKSKDMKAGKIVIKKLKAKKTYYVRIRTVKTVNGVTARSSWSKVLKATKTK